MNEPINNDKLIIEQLQKEVEQLQRELYEMMVMKVEAEEELERLKNK